MKIEAYSRHGEIGFVVRAEDASERALLTYLTSAEYTNNRIFRIGGSTYECDYSAVTSFNFGWDKKEELK